MSRCFVFGIVSILISCSMNMKPVDTLFKLVAPEHSNLTFVNSIQESDSINIFSYEYLYNGGGVGILDINNDGLNDIFFTGNQVSSALYLNKGNMQFTDVSLSAGIQLKGEWCTGISILDINNDGWDDIYVCVGGPGNQDNFPNRLFINQKNMTFVEAAAEYGLADRGESIQAAFFDYDKDGDLDLYLLTGGGFERSAIVARPMLVDGENRNTDRLYKNTFDHTLQHPVFTNVSREAGILTEGFGLGVAILDANQDSWPDVFVSNDYISRDQLYINNTNGTFSDRSLEYFNHTSHFSMGNDVGDINNDGLPDIITVDMLPDDLRRRKLMFGPNDLDRFNLAVQYGYNSQYMRNMLHLNHGNNGFSEIGQFAGIYKTDWSWAPLLADFDHDGLQDLFITNGFGKDVTDLDFVKFRHTAGGTAFTDRRKLEKLFQDSLRQRPRVILPNYMYRNNGDMTFSNEISNWGFKRPSISSGAAYADMDGDGDLELIVNNIDQPAFLYKNRLVETNPDSAHYLKIRLTGTEHNRGAIGTTIRLYAAGKVQYRFAQVVRGFQSTVDKTIHFGLGPIRTADSIEVIWPDGRQNTLTNVAADTTISLVHAEAVKKNARRTATQKLFSRTDLIDFIHKETPFNDFRQQPLLLHGMANQGPAIAVGDINGDRLDDVFIGGAYGSAGHFYIQTSTAKFIEHTLSTEQYEDLGALLFDADDDGDLDLFVASGGSERYAGHEGYQDRLYVNNGTGGFTHRPSALPVMLTSTSCVTAGDVDSDGDLDLFIGGRMSPGEYPTTPRSYVLENKAGNFTDVTGEISSTLANVGMVTSAVWTDFNNDHQQDLVVTGEFMQVTVFQNEKGRLTDITGSAGLASSYGLWNSIQPGDFDNDGDIDFVAGNFGLNNPYHIDANHPLEVRAADFDNNGSVDPLFSSYEDNVSYPIPSLDVLTRQLPQLKKHMLYYRQYASVTTNDLIQILGNKSHQTFRCNLATSSFIENKGNGKFNITPLPDEAQLAPVNGILAEDINYDGLLDIVLIGNFSSGEVVAGKYDASIGTVLINQDGHSFKPLPPSSSGFVVKGDGRALARVQLSTGKAAYLVSQNNEKALTFVGNNRDLPPTLRFAAHETHALVSLTSGDKRKMEFTLGGGYMSQNSPTLFLHENIEQVTLYDVFGKVTRNFDKHDIQQIRSRQKAATSPQL